MFEGANAIVSLTFHQPSMYSCSCLAGISLIPGGCCKWGTKSWMYLLPLGGHWKVPARILSKFVELEPVLPKSCSSGDCRKGVLVACVKCQCASLRRLFLSSGLVLTSLHSSLSLASGGGYIQESCACYFGFKCSSYQSCLLSYSSGKSNPLPWPFLVFSVLPLLPKSFFLARCPISWFVL